MPSRGQVSILASWEAIVHPDVWWWRQTRACGPCVPYRAAQPAAAEGKQYTYMVLLSSYLVLVCVRDAPLDWCTVHILLQTKTNNCVPQAGARTNQADVEGTIVMCKVLEWHAASLVVKLKSATSTKPVDLRYKKDSKEYYPVPVTSLFHDYPKAGKWALVLAWLFQFFAWHIKFWGVGLWVPSYRALGVHAPAVPAALLGPEGNTTVLGILLVFWYGLLALAL